MREHPARPSAPAAANPRSERAQRRAEPPSLARSIGISVAVLLIVGAGVSSFLVLLEPGWWAATTFACVVVALAAAAVARHTLAGWRGVWGALAALAALLPVFLGLFGGTSTVAGIVPTASTPSRFVELVLEAQRSIAEQSRPAEADLGITFLLAASVSVVAIVVDALAHHGRRPAIAIIPALALLAPAIIIAPGETPVTTLIGFAAASLLLLFAARPAPVVDDARTVQRAGERTVATPTARSAGRALAVAATALVGAVVLPLVLPPVLPGAVPQSSGPAPLVAGIDPSLELGNDLRRSDPVLAVRYTTDAPTGHYLTLAHLADIGAQSVEPVLDGVDATVEVIGPPPWLDDSIATTTSTTSIALERVRTRWVPLPSAPVSTSGLDGQWLVDLAGVSVATTTGSLRGANYTVESLIASPTVEQLQAASVDAPGLDRYRALPDDLPPIIRELARQATLQATNPYERALALQRFFRGGDFAYSEFAPVDQGFDGTGTELIAQFLQVRAGYCVHFASAMTMMARAEGIPARIAVGFVPGSPDDDDPGVEGAENWVVTTDELHAWPELHFDGIGWVRFEPTPSRGDVPDWAQPSALPDTAEPEPIESIEPTVPTATATPVAPSPPVETPEPTPTDIDVVGPGLDEGAEGRVSARAVSAVLFALLMVVLLVTPAIWRAVRRTTRGRSDNPAQFWREARDTARDLGLPAEPTVTPRALAASWQVDEAAPVLEALEAQAYDEPARERLPSVTRPELTALLTALRRRAPWWRRVLARLLPVSLFERPPRS